MEKLFKVLDQSGNLLGYERLNSGHWEYQWDGEDNWCKGLMVEHPEKVIRLQYLGIKDKLGNQIFEGDIARKMDFDLSGTEGWKFGDPRWIGYETLLKEVKRDVVTMEHYRFWLKNEEFGDEGEGLEYPSYWEIIGNIHKNPELLNEKP